MPNTIHSNQARFLVLCLLAPIIVQCGPNTPTPLLDALHAIHQSEVFESPWGYLEKSDHLNPGDSEQAFWQSATIVRWHQVPERKTVQVEYHNDNIGRSKVITLPKIEITPMKSENKQDELLRHKDGSQALHEQNHLLKFTTESPNERMPINCPSKIELWLNEIKIDEFQWIEKSPKICLTNIGYPAKLDKNEETLRKIFNESLNSPRLQIRATYSLPFPLVDQKWKLILNKPKWNTEILSNRSSLFYSDTAAVIGNMRNELVSQFSSLLKNQTEKRILSDLFSYEFLLRSDRINFNESIEYFSGTSSAEKTSIETQEPLEIQSVNSLQLIQSSAVLLESGSPAVQTNNLMKTVRIGNRIALKWKNIESFQAHWNPHVELASSYWQCKNPNKFHCVQGIWVCDQNQITTHTRQISCPGGPRVVCEEQEEICLDPVPPTPTLQNSETKAKACTNVRTSCRRHSTKCSPSQWTQEVIPLCQLYPKPIKTPQFTNETEQNGYKFQCSQTNSQSCPNLPKDPTAWFIDFPALSASQGAWIPIGLESTHIEQIRANSQIMLTDASGISSICPWTSLSKQSGPLPQLEVIEISPNAACPLHNLNPTQQWNIKVLISASIPLKYPMGRWNFSSVPINTVYTFTPPNDLFRPYISPLRAQFELFSLSSLLTTSGDNQ